MSETTFENAKVGDRVWGVGMGWGTIVDHNGYRFNVDFDGKLSIRYNKQGKEYKDENQTLFWDEIKIVPPERPKRKVVKTAEVWMNINKDGSNSIYFSGLSAECAGRIDRIACVHLTGTYEVEE